MEGGEGREETREGARKEMIGGDMGEGREGWSIGRVEHWEGGALGGWNIGRVEYCRVEHWEGRVKHWEGGAPLPML